MTIYLNLDYTSKGAVIQLVNKKKPISTFRSFTKKMMTPLRHNPFYPEFCDYIKRNEGKLLTGFKES